MTHLEAAIQAQLIMFLKRYASNDNRAWEYVSSCFKKRGGKCLLQCNFDFFKAAYQCASILQGMSLFLVILGEVDR